MFQVKRSSIPRFPFYHFQTKTQQEHSNLYFHISPLVLEHNGIHITRRTRRSA